MYLYSMKCKNKKCNIEHDGLFGNGIFCSKKCACSYAGLKADKNKQREAAIRNKNGLRLKEFNEKIQIDNINKKETERLSKEHFCESCGIKNEGLYGSGRFCSKGCSNKREWSEDKKNKHSKIAKKSDNVLAANSKRSFKIIKECVICKKEFSVRKSEIKKKYCTKKCFVNDKDFKYRNKAKGGFREGSGLGKSGWYKGIQCDSSYELAWVIYNLEHEISFIRNKKGFEYVFNGITRKYYPDYYLPNSNEYVEIKGFKTEQNEAKISQFAHKIKVLYKNDLSNVFNYVVGKYGKNFIELYEGNPYKLKKNKCGICGEPSKNKYCSRVCSGKSVNLKKNK
jgi:hypothetical protein